MGIVIETAGWIGSGLVLGAYLLTSLGRIGSRSAAFQWMNFIGALGLVANALWHSAWPLVALDLAWAVIGIAALIQIARGTTPAQQRA